MINNEAEDGGGRGQQIQDGNGQECQDEGETGNNFTSVIDRSENWLKVNQY